jgi:hypothetical protein
MIRRLAAWPPRRIALVWLCGIALQAALFVALSEPQTPEDRARSAWMDSVARAPQPAPAPIPPAVRDSFLQLLRDSSGIDVRLDSRGEVASVRITDTATARMFGQAARGIGQALDRMFLKIALLLLGIPALLIVFTLAWWWARRRARKAPA